MTKSEIMLVIKCKIGFLFSKSKVESLMVKISNIAGIMSKHRKYRELHSHEEFIHKCEK